MDGFLLIDKPVGFTSFDVCAKMRKAFDTRKVGHTGTLDPFATGLLIVAIGKCTRLIPFLEKDRKTYRTKIVLNQTSETLDPESEIVQGDFSGDIPTLEQVQEVLETHFKGKITQIPPKYSALKVGGKKLCDLARKGIEVEIKPREAEVFHIKILNYSYPEIEIELEAAAGFYVRSFARDLGEKLVGSGMCQELRRLKVGNLHIDDADNIEQVSTTIDPKHIITLDTREIETGRVQDFVSGRAFPLPGVEGDRVLVLVGGKSLGVGEFKDGKLQPRIVL